MSTNETTSEDQEHEPFCCHKCAPNFPCWDDWPNCQRGFAHQMPTPKTTEADLFWDDNDPEFSATDIADILDSYPLGEVVRIQRAARLHDVFAVRVDDDMREFDTLEEASIWADQQKKENQDAES